VRWWYALALRFCSGGGGWAQRAGACGGGWWGVGSRGLGGFGASAQPLNASIHPNQTHTLLHQASLTQTNPTHLSPRIYPHTCLHPNQTHTLLPHA